MSKQISPKLVVAGAGYVGTALVLRARDLGMEVTAVTRNLERIANFERQGIAAVACTLSDIGDFRDSLPDRVDYVVNLVSSASRSPEGYRESYIEGQQALMDWAISSGARRYVYTSSTSVYGEHGGDWVDEDTPLAPASQFGEILVEAERCVEGSVLDSTVLRLGGIYGPERHLLWNQVVHAEGQTLPGYGDIYLNLIHREDIVGAILAVLSRERLPRARYNAVDGRPSTRQEIVDWIAVELGRGPLRYDPASAHKDARGSRFSGGRRPNRKIRSSYLSQEVGWTPAIEDFRAGYRQLGLC
ncbi:MAG: NAD-dependent epimerase/dehydratase family protein [Opitutales bacterium]|nr:NAD-dependent epimerase/dehydratase family protein [Opitutales bacterium]